MGIKIVLVHNLWGLPGGSVVKNLCSKAAVAGSIPGSGRSPGKGNGNQLPYSCLGNPWTEEPGRLQVHRVAKKHDLVATKQQ